MRIVAASVLVVLLLSGCFGHCGPSPAELTWRQAGLYEAVVDHPEAQGTPAKGPAWNLSGVDVSLGLMQVSDQAGGRGEPTRHELSPGAPGDDWVLRRIHQDPTNDTMLRAQLAGFLDRTGQTDVDVDRLLQRLADNRTHIGTSYGSGSEPRADAVYQSVTTLAVDVDALRADTANVTREHAPSWFRPGVLHASAGTLKLDVSLDTARLVVAVADGRSEVLFVDALDRASLAGGPPTNETDQRAWLQNRLAEKGLPEAGIMDLSGEYAIC